MYLPKRIYIYCDSMKKKWGTVLDLNKIYLVSSNWNVESVERERQDGREEKTSCYVDWILMLVWELVSRNGNGNKSAQNIFLFRLLFLLIVMFISLIWHKHKKKNEGCKSWTKNDNANSCHNLMIDFFIPVKLYIHQKSRICTK